MVNRGIFPVPSDEGGGAEQHSYFLTNTLAELGHEVHYVTDVVENAGFHKNVIVHEPRTPMLKQKANFYGYALGHFIGNTFAFKGAFSVLIQERFNFDVIHCHGALSSLSISIVRNRVPLLFTVHDPTPYMCRYQSSLERLIRKAHCRFIDMNTWRNADHLITVGENIKQELMRWEVPYEKITVIPSGVDTDMFKPSAPNDDYLFEKYNVKNPYCLFVGRLTPRKGVKYLLQALKEVDIQCAIVGDGPQRDYLMSLSKNIGIQNRVFFTGFVPLKDLIALYSSASFFALPSLAEGLPLAILEAMSCGLPVIATNVGGIPDTIIDEYNGFLIETEDVQRLSHVIELLAEDSKLCQEMGKNARQIIESRFSWRSIAEKTVEVYRNCRCRETG